MSESTVNGVSVETQNKLTDKLSVGREEDLAFEDPPRGNEWHIRVVGRVTERDSFIGHWDTAYPLLTYLYLYLQL